MINPPKPYYAPRRYPASAIVAVSCQVVLAALLVISATYFIAPMHRGTNIAGPQEIWADLEMDDIRLGIQARLMALSLAGALGGATAGLLAWRRTPRSEPFSQIDGTEPQVFYDGDAREVLQRRLFAEAGAKAERGLYLAPHLAMPRDAEQGFAMRGQAGFFDIDERLKDLSSKGDDLERLNGLIDFEMFRSALEQAVPRGSKQRR